MQIYNKLLEYIAFGQAQQNANYTNKYFCHSWLRQAAKPSARETCPAIAGGENPLFMQYFNQ
ncbi:MAG: hypothetical protein LBN23_07810 [Paludibacter sp.]|jgi:hypothetical protein|nr:hypothetical protein [Paludibacter sp.]